MMLIGYFHLLNQSKMAVLETAMQLKLEGFKTQLSVLLNVIKHLISIKRLHKF